MNKLREAFKLPVLEDLQDYKKSTNIVIAAAYFLPTIFILYFFGMKIHLIVSLMVLIVMIFLYREVLLRDLIVFKDNLKPYIPFVLLCIVIEFILSNVVGSTITATILDTITEMNTSLSSPNQNSVTSVVVGLPPFIGFIAMVIAGPIVEELMFRRTFKIVFKSKFLYYLLSSLAFCLAHMIVGFTFPLSFAYIFTYLFSGLVYAYGYDKTNNIWASIFIHMFNNGLGYALILLSS